MDFKDILKNYMEILSIKPKKLAYESGISGIMIEEILEGKRVPKIGSTQLDSIIDAIERIADEKEGINIEHKDVFYDLMTAVRQTHVEPEPVNEKITSILHTLHVSPKDLAKGVGCTTVFLSQLRSGDAIPDDPEDFADRLATFLTENYTDEAGAAKLSNVIGVSAVALKHAERARVEIREWFLEGCVNDEADILSSIDVDTKIGETLESVEWDLRQISPEIITCGRIVLDVINSRGTEDSYVQIYQNMGREELETILANDFATTTRQLTLRNSLPIASMPMELLDRILFRNKVEGLQRLKTMEFYDFITRHAAERLAMAPHFDVVPKLSREAFEEHPLSLELDEDEISKKLYYTYDEYLEHLAYYSEYVARNSNLTVVFTDHLNFPNLAIRVRSGECVIITRSSEPKMNLIISERNICDMFEEYISLVLLGKDKQING